MTYAESRNAAPFDWNAFLNKETYNMVELHDANVSAISWKTCPCGIQDESIPRNKHGMPDDHELFSLSLEFCERIFEMNQSNTCLNEELFNESKSEAFKLFKEIESRSAYLIQQINENK